MGYGKAFLIHYRSQRNRKKKIPCGKRAIHSYLFELLLSGFIKPNRQVLGQVVLHFMSKSLQPIYGQLFIYGQWTLGSNRGMSNAEYWEAVQWLQERPVPRTVGFLCCLLTMNVTSRNLWHLGNHINTGIFWLYLSISQGKKRFVLFPINNPSLFKNMQGAFKAFVNNLKICAMTEKVFLRWWNLKWKWELRLAALEYNDKRFGWNDLDLLHPRFSVAYYQFFLNCEYLIWTENNFYLVQGYQILGVHE